MQPDNGTTDTVLQDNRRPVFTTIKLPYEVWRAVRDASSDRRVPQQEIHVAALREYLNIPEEMAEKPHPNAA
jgi:hypothetical protein